MDSSRISKLAEGARVALMEDVRNNLDRVLLPQSDERLSEPSAVCELEDFVRNRGEDKAVEEIAYTWFNRLCALRFMDMRGYTPVGCVTSRPGGNLPAILADAREGAYSSALKMAEAQKEAVSAILSGAKPSSNPLGEAYVLLLLAACDSYRDAMGYLFSGDVQKRAAMRLLAPSDLLSEQSVLRRICEGMDAEACESVEVLGWLYQFYIAERKDEVLASKKKRSGVEEIGPATQLFTPNWIVRYLVDNSVGRLWMLNNPGSAVEKKMEFFVKPDGETEEFIKVYGPEDITVCDPACGSGHILVYAFDLLYEMYLEEGYRSDQIPQMVLENNLFGMEIDDRAAEIASFALEMKAREKDPDFFSKCVDANITVLEPIIFGEGELKGAGRILQQHELLEAFEHMDEIGSLYVPAEDDLEVIDEAIENLKGGGGIFVGHAIEQLGKMRRMVNALVSKYSAVVANPPYMGSSTMEENVKSWIWRNYPNSKTDLCACFIERGFLLADSKAYNSMITMHSWMFLGSYEKLRRMLSCTKIALTCAHLGPRAFEAIGGEVVSTAATVFVNEAGNILGNYFRLVEYTDSERKKTALLSGIESPQKSKDLYRASMKDFSYVPGYKIGYWASQKMISLFSSNPPAGEVIALREGIHTGKNELFLRNWAEISFSDVVFNASNYLDIDRAGRWVPYAKGGTCRKWYGNHELLIRFDKASRDEMAKLSGHVRPSESLYFKGGSTWSALSSGNFGLRLLPKGFLFDSKGQVAVGDVAHEVMCLFNTSVYQRLADVLMPTLDYKCGDAKLLPYCEIPQSMSRLGKINVALSKNDWDSFEESWDFAKHPIVRWNENLWDATSTVYAMQHHYGCLPEASSPVETAYLLWQGECKERFDELKSNEEELNRIFARIYDMEEEVEIEVPNDKVSVRLADKARDMRSLVSYGIGCMFGRYSLQKEGLILADQGSTLADFLEKVPTASFLPDDDNILPILDEEWFEDDIVAGLRRWLSAAFGEDSLDANIAFIEQGLGTDLRSYFTKEFYKDHVKVYQKRPIYWLIQSPKKNFQALVYMHRMDKDTITKVLTDYVQPFRRKLDAQVQVLRATGVNRDAAKADKYQAIIQEMIDWERDVLYPMSQKRIEIDLDDGVKKNYPLFKGAVAKVQGLL